MPSALDDILSKHGLTPPNIKETTFLSTGSWMFDRLIGGGLMRGKLTVFWGQPAHGKSTAAIAIAAEVTRRGCWVAYFDSDKSFSAKRFRAFGANMDNIKVYQPSTVEEFFGTVNGYMPKGATKPKLGLLELNKPEGFEVFGKSLFDLIICDSIAALQTAAEFAMPAGTRMVSSSANTVTPALTTMINKLANSDTAMLFTSEARAEMDAGYGGKPYRMAGAYKLRHSTSMQIELLTPQRYPPEKDKPMKVFIIRPIRNGKSKTNTPALRQCDINIIVGGGSGGYGFDTVGELAILACEFHIFWNDKEGTKPIKASNNNHFYKGELIGKRAEVHQRLMEDDSFYEAIAAEVRAAMKQEIEYDDDIIAMPDEDEIEIYGEDDE